MIGEGKEKYIEWFDADILLFPWKTDFCNHWNKFVLSYYIGNNIDQIMKRKVTNVL